MKILFWFSDAIDGNRLFHQLKLNDKIKYDLAFNHKEFQEKFNSFLPDIIVLDIDKNDSIVAKFNLIIKDKFPQVKRLIVSKNMEADDFKKHQKSDQRANGYIKKPLRPEFLEELFDDYLAIQK